MKKSTICSRKAEYIENFRRCQARAGIDTRIIDLCSAYIRYHIKKDKAFQFYHLKKPTKKNLLQGRDLPRKSREYMEKFLTMNKGIDTRVLEFLINYFNIFLENQLPIILHDQHLANLLGIPKAELYWLAYGGENGGADHYYTFIISKKSGGSREIHAPKTRLKEVQRWILKNILQKVAIHKCAKGFVKKQSIVGNAEAHLNQRLVICLDIQNFFPTVTFKRVLGVFLSFYYPFNVALLLAKLTTCRGRLPQGAPSSPAITNIICNRLDKRLYHLAEKLRLKYTRYADDLTFSGSGNVNKIVPEIIKLIKEEGFNVAKEKIRFARSGARQSVTGLVVNDKLNIPREKRRRLRAIIHNCKMHGVSSQNREGRRDFRAYLYGYAGFFTMVNRKLGWQVLSRLNELNWTE